MRQDDEEKEIVRRYVIDGISYEIDEETGILVESKDQDQSFDG